jgi:hypothetical protein
MKFSFYANTALTAAKTLYLRFKVTLLAVNNWTMHNKVFGIINGKR